MDEAGGFADFRESATKTMSILDRLEKLTLTELSDVENGLEKYLEQKKKAIGMKAKNLGKVKKSKRIGKNFFQCQYKR